jgi:hypothetical protein
MDGGLGMEYQISHVQSDQLRDTQATSEGKMKHCTVPQPGPATRIRGVQQSLNLFAIEISDDDLICLLHGDSTNSAGLLKARR